MGQFRSTPAVWIDTAEIFPKNLVHLKMQVWSNAAPPIRMLLGHEEVPGISNRICAIRCNPLVLLGACWTRDNGLPGAALTYIGTAVDLLFGFVVVRRKMHIYDRVTGVVNGILASPFGFGRIRNYCQNVAGCRVWYTCGPLEVR